MSEYPSGYRPQTSFAKPSNLTLPINTGISASHPSQTNPAKWTHRQLIECIYDFEKSLGDEHEVGARLLSLPSEVTFHIEDVRCYDTHMISFYGSNENGEKLQLIQHVSQLSVLLVAMNKRGEDTVRIGFKLKRAAEDDGR